MGYKLISFSLAFSCSKWRRLSDDSPLYDDSLSDESFPFTHRVDKLQFIFQFLIFDFLSIFFCFQCFIRSLINRIDRVPRSTCYWQLLFNLDNMTHYSDPGSLLSSWVQGSTDRNPLVLNRAVRSWSGPKFSPRTGPGLEKIKIDFCRDSSLIHL